MDSQSLAAAGLLAALSRASGILAELHHPFVRREHFSVFIPPAGARIRTAFTLPDGREVSFEVSIAASADAFHVEGSITAEDEIILALPRKSVLDIHDALVVLDDYAGDLAAPAGRTIDQLLEGLI
ncbi:hypothetical protein [Nonomuraea basaltis]|uniref:hypothetical protein n=1 Tax=Nonomuraea basaltis TaxID=2495887 RepID=UPI00110C50AC|nr:hypothetical protein [Nonomuraea basaltis]TMR97396.1 hypothetical protein EJK15_18525 [Nonomuraea basaltis]